MSKFEVLDAEKNGVYIVRLTDGEFNGIEYRYGEASFDLEEEGTLHFNYFVEKDEFNELADESAEQRFRQEIGDILMQLIEQSIERQELVCAGGT